MPVSVVRQGCRLFVYPMLDTMHSHLSRTLFPLPRHCVLVLWMLRLPLRMLICADAVFQERECSIDWSTVRARSHNRSFDKVYQE